MHKFRVIAKTTCYVCNPKRDHIINDYEIQARDENAARAVFFEKHKLCPYCFREGTKAAVEFDTKIFVERLSSAGV
jgi:hypothetical protein